MSKIGNKLTVVISTVVAAGMIVSGCSLVEKTPEAIAKQKVAKVGSEYITRGEFDKDFEPIKEQIIARSGKPDYFDSEEGKQVLTETKGKFLDNMINQKIVNKKAEELSLIKDQNEISTEVDKQVEEMKKNFKDEKEFEDVLKQQHLTIDIMKKFLKDDIVYKKVYDETTKDVTVSDDEVSKYYEQNKSMFTEKPNSMNVSHIVVDTEEKAKDIKAKIDKGEDFAKLAKEFSTEPAAKTSGGDLGEIKYNDQGYDPTFVAAAMTLKEGQVSDPVKTQWGYHIIKVTKLNEYPVLPFDKVKDKIKDNLLKDAKGKKFNDSLTAWNTELKVKKYDKNLNN